MRRIFTFIASLFLILLSLAIITAAGISCYFLLKAVWNILSTLHNDLALTIVALFLAVVISVIAGAVAKHAARKEELQREVRERKMPVYQAIIGCIQQLIHKTKATKAGVTLEEVDEFFNAHAQELFTRASNEVIARWNSYKQLLLKKEKEQGSVGSADELDKLEEILLAIREDSGYSSVGVPRGGLVKLLITDRELKK